MINELLLLLLLLIFFYNCNDITFSSSNTITPHPLQLRMFLSNTHHYFIVESFLDVNFVLLGTKVLTTLHHSTCIIHFHFMHTCTFFELFLFISSILLSLYYPLLFHPLTPFLISSFDILSLCTPRTSFQNMFLISPLSTSSAFSYTGVMNAFCCEKKVEALISELLSFWVIWYLVLPVVPWWYLPTGLYM